VLTVQVGVRDGLDERQGALARLLEKRFDPSKGRCSD
jgi:hypothetical protein